MNVTCAICVDFLTPTCDLSSLPCGHVFHSDCVLKWLATGKDSCPQCRSNCSSSQLRRIYFTEGMESKYADPNTLQNKINELTLKFRNEVKEKKTHENKASELSAQNTCLKEEFKSLEKKYKNAVEEILSLRNQVRVLQRGNERAKLPKHIWPY